MRVHASRSELSFSGFHDWSIFDKSSGQTVLHRSSLNGIMKSTPTQDESRRRPNLFRALGTREAPTEIQVDGEPFQLERTIKHDSWAATAVYGNEKRRIVCKFNRIQPILFLPCRWLGRWLARRESAMYERLADVPNISAGFSAVFCNGERLENAAAHEFIAGHPLSWHDRVADDFFEKLRGTIAELHRRNIAYVDLNKWENIIVDQAGDPWLIDFQISVTLPKIWPLNVALRILQDVDMYHLSKHASRIRPDLYRPENFTGCPAWIRLHRRIANPVRALRRRLLVLLGIRKGKGKPQSEQFVEEGLRPTGERDTPIVRLYRLVQSAEYVAYAIAGGSPYIDVAFVDLVGRTPVSEGERQFLERLKSQTPHDQAVWLLKSTLFLALTSQWEDRVIEQKIQQITAKLNKLGENRSHAA
jgi:hypothetical protein